MLLKNAFVDKYFGRKRLKCLLVADIAVIYISHYTLFCTLLLPGFAQLLRIASTHLIILLCDCGFLRIVCVRFRELHLQTTTNQLTTKIILVKLRIAAKK